ncbi:hypothetical protein K432DRAFT_305157, partial [Lepidopterella palustris CBS 459.81]
ELISTLPVSSSRLTMASCPLAAAIHSGVRSSQSLESGSTLSSNSFTIVSCPFATASSSGV